MDLKNTDSVDLYDEFQKIRLNIDKVDTPNLSKIKEIIKRVNFANILTKQQALDNKGETYYKLYENSEGDYFSNLTLSYTILANKTGMVYGLFKEEKDSNGVKKPSFTAGKMNNYARFLVDVTSKKIIFSKELDSFVRVEKNKFTVIDKFKFELDYPTNERKMIISDFLPVMEEIFRSVINTRTHDYTIHPYTFAGNDWLYNCQTLSYEDYKLEDNDLFFDYYDVNKKDLKFSMAGNYLNLIADGKHSLHNLRLLHAYTMLRKLELEPPEYFFIMKDFGRTGKGLLMHTFNEIFKVNNVNFDNLKSGGFESNNEWLNFYDSEVAHANETGEIDQKSMRVLRKIATSEAVTGRGIGHDSVTFKITATLILDTNEAVDIGELTANKSRTVKIALKDRPKQETSEERRIVFKPYWEFIHPNDENSLSASLAFLINSLDYYKEMGRKFVFSDVALKNYYRAEDLTETQLILLKGIKKQGFIFASDEILQKAVQEDYGSFRFKKAKDDVKKVGVGLNRVKWLDGQSHKVHVKENEELFNQATGLVEENEDKNPYP